MRNEKYKSQYKYYEKNKEVILDKYKLYYEKNKEKKRQYYLENKAHIIERSKNYKLKRKEDELLKTRDVLVVVKPIIEIPKPDKPQKPPKPSPPEKTSRPYLMGSQKLINIDMKNVRINQSDLLYEIILSKGKGERTEKLDRMFVEMTKKLSDKFSFNITYDEKQDLINSGVLRLLETYHTFNEVKYDNAFSYYSEIIKRAFAQEFNQVRARKQKSYYRDFEFVPISPNL